MLLGLTHWPPGFSRTLVAVSFDGQLSMIAPRLLMARTHGMPCGRQTRGKETVFGYRSVQWEKWSLPANKEKNKQKSPLLSTGTFSHVNSLDSSFRKVLLASFYRGGGD